MELAVSTIRLSAHHRHSFNVPCAILIAQWPVQQENQSNFVICEELNVPRPACVEKSPIQVEDDELDGHG